MKRIFIIIILCLSAIIGQAQISLQAELRPRFELNHGYRDPAVVLNTPVAVISQRSRIQLSYESEKLRLHFSPQDVRVWGDEDMASSTGVYGDNASLSLFEGYAEIRTGKLGWLSIGRQSLVYDQQWLLAARNWNQNGLAYDAVLWKLNLNGTKLHIGTSWNTMAAASDNLYPEDRIKCLNFLWAEREINQNMKLSLLHISSGKTESDSTEKLEFKQTSGLFADFKNDKLNAFANAYYQYGQNQRRQAVDAFLLDVKLSLTPGKFLVGGSVSCLSGDGNLSDNTDALFDNLYGARHRYFGHMDYFRNMGSHTKSGGLEDYSLFAGYTAGKSVKLQWTLHYFRLNKLNEITPDNKNLGIENELGIGWKISDSMKLNAAWLIYSPTNAFKTLKGYDSNRLPQFLYLELTIKPTIYKSKNK